MQIKPQQYTKKWWFILAFLAVLVMAGAVRTYHLDWDQGTHLHPDERYLTMVVSAIRFPETLKAYWDTDNSPLNPTNYEQFAGYVYGTLPLFTTRAAGTYLDHACAPDPGLMQILLRAILFSTRAPCTPGLYTGYGGIHLVGRLLSTVADLLALVALTLLARSLYDQRVALLAAALYAFAVLPIQHAHFFVVDSFATVFVMWTLFFAVQAVQSRSPWWLLPAGLTTGLAVASKISVWPLAGIVALATFLQYEVTVCESHSGPRYRLQFKPFPFFIAVLSGALAALAFRAGQPYAFTGPGFFDVRINPQWLATMRDVRDLMAGLRDVPYGHQWTARMPILFPGRNMIFWGVGLPLGIVAWLGWGTLGWRIVRKWHAQHLLVWVWGTLFFLYQSTQWVKSMRYLLPIYPVFALFAAWLLMHAFRTGQKLALKGHSSKYKLVSFALRTLPSLVLGGTMLWTLAFLQIYNKPVTRIQASQWMFKHIPTAMTIYTTEKTSIQLPVQPNISIDATRPIGTKLTVEQATEFTQVILNKVTGMGTAGERAFRVELTSDPEGELVLAEGIAKAHIPATGTAGIAVNILQPLTIQAQAEAYIWVHLLQGPPVQLQSSVIANEHWDDPLPLRIEGKDPFWNWYQSLSTSASTQMNNYDEDTLDKRAQLLDWLDEADYIVLSSNRLYGSIPRLPLRYPLTTTYYETLFNGSLGFELLAEFVSFPRLGPCQFPDQELPFVLSPPRYTNAKPCSISYPPAEEAFSVYDHPTVLIFAKTPAYTRQLAEALLPPSLLDHVRWMTPLEATRGKNDIDGQSLLMDTRTNIAQASGGTWHRLFKRDAPQNRFQLLAVLLWWMLLTFLGIMAYPWLFFAFPALRYRGYGLARIVGLLLWAYVTWLLTSLHIIPNTRLWLWAALLIGAGASALTYHAHRQKLLAFLRENWKPILRIELIFMVLYLIWVYIRYLNPDLWHPIMGGEKPMDFAYLNAVIKSTWFPPYDPWFTGGKMNYYYFGLVIVGVMIKALGIIPSIAYNLAVPSLFAMTGVGAYTLGANLVSGSDKRRHRTGLWAILLVLILGNLGEVQLLFKGFEEIGNVDFESLIPGYPALISALVGFWKVVFQGKSLVFRPEWWYWNARSVIPFNPGEAGTINEFPAFTFLYADLHAHMIAMPLTQIALAVAIQWTVGWIPKKNVTIRSSWRWLPWPPGAWLTFFLAALTAGALRATNTWDYPTYLALMSCGLLIRAFHIYTLTPEKKFPYLILSVPILLLGTAEVLFYPFTQHYVVTYTSFNLWEGSRTPLGIYCIMHGQFLLPLVVLAGMQIYKVIQKVKQLDDEETRGTWAALAAVGAGMVILLLTLIYLGIPVAWIVVPLGVAAAILLLAPSSEPRTRLMWLWVGTALALSLLVEVIVLKGDIGRMNTVFKFYIQVWMLMALGACVGVSHIMAHVLNNYRSERPTSSTKNFLTDALFSILSILLLAAALYPALAIPARVRDRWRPEAPHTLDGAAFMPYAVQYEHGGEIPLDVDYRVIRWLQDNVEGSPTIIEGQAEREYLWGNRISVHTGLPSVVGWRWHQVQQRMVMPGYTVEGRQQAVREFYNTVSPERAMDILKQYDVEYVILTPYERAYMLPEGESKFMALVAQGWLEIVYQEPEARIYRVVVDL